MRAGVLLRVVAVRVAIFFVRVEGDLLVLEAVLFFFRAAVRRFAGAFRFFRGLVTRPSIQFAMRVLREGWGARGARGATIRAPNRTSQPANPNVFEHLRAVTRATETLRFDAVRYGPLQKILRPEWLLRRAGAVTYDGLEPRPSNQRTR